MAIGKIPITAMAIRTDVDGMADRSVVCPTTVLEDRNWISWIIRFKRF